MNEKDCKKCIHCNKYTLFRFCEIRKFSMFFKTSHAKKCRYYLEGVFK